MYETYWISCIILETQRWAGPLPTGTGSRVWVELYLLKPTWLTWWARLDSLFSHSCLVVSLLETLSLNTSVVGGKNWLWQLSHSFASNFTHHHVPFQSQQNVWIVQFTHLVFSHCSYIVHSCHRVTSCCMFSVLPRGHIVAEDKPRANNIISNSQTSNLVGNDQAQSTSAVVVP